MKNRRNRIYYWIGGLLAFIGMGAVAAGVGLILNPDGSGLGMKVELLAESPFRNFLIPGISLFLINGIGSFLGAALALKRHIFAGIVTIILGAAMIIWISAQVYWVKLDADILFPPRDNRDYFRCHCKEREARGLPLNPLLACPFQSLFPLYNGISNG